MYAEDIQKYLKDYSNSLNKHNHVHINIQSSIISKTSDNELNIHLSDKFDILDIKILIPTDRQIPATIKIIGENYKINTKIGNSRNVPIKQDIDVVSQVIIASIEHKDAIEYIKKKLKEIFDTKATSQTQSNVNLDKSEKIKNFLDLDKEGLSKIIIRANFKGANILKWLKTPNNKIVLKYKYKKDENYGSETEANTHLYYAYMLKNKNPSTRLF